MLSLLGEYDCKVDAKGRMLLPSGIKRQLAEVLHEGFVLNRDIHTKCVVLYPQKAWNETSAEVLAKNRFVQKNAQFIRRFTNGATPVELDGSGRLLLPKHLAEFGDIKKEVKVCGMGDRIEIWSKANYKAMLEEDIDMTSLAEDVMGGQEADG